MWCVLMTRDPHPNLFFLLDEPGAVLLCSIDCYITRRTLRAGSPAILLYTFPDSGSVRRTWAWPALPSQCAGRCS